MIQRLKIREQAVKANSEGQSIWAPHLSNRSSGKEGQSEEKGGQKILESGGWLRDHSQKPQWIWRENHLDRSRKSGWGGDLEVKNKLVHCLKQLSIGEIIARNMMGFWNIWGKWVSVLENQVNEEKINRKIIVGERKYNSWHVTWLRSRQ